MSLPLLSCFISLSILTWSIVLQPVRVRLHALPLVYFFFQHSAPSPAHFSLHAPQLASSPVIALNTYPARALSPGSKAWIMHFHWPSQCIDALHPLVRITLGDAFDLCFLYWLSSWICMLQGMRLCYLSNTFELYSLTVAPSKRENSMHSLTCKREHKGLITRSWSIRQNNAASHRFRYTSFHIFWLPLKPLIRCLIERFFAICNFKSLVGICSKPSNLAQRKKDVRQRREERQGPVKSLSAPVASICRQRYSPIDLRLFKSLGTDSFIAFF